MKETYDKKITIRISSQMLNELDEFVLNYGSSKNSIIRQAISSWLNSATAAPKRTIVQPVSTPAVKADDPFSDSIYNW